MKFSTYILAFAWTCLMHSSEAFMGTTKGLRTCTSRFASMAYDFDLIIVGCGVGGHGAALHARSNGLKTAIFTGKDVGGTCVNRGCVPSKALLAASGRIREMKNQHHLKSFGISVGDVNFDREGVAGHAQQLADKVKANLGASLGAQGVEIIDSLGALTGTAHEVKATDTGKVYTAENIIRIERFYFSVRKKTVLK